MGVDEHELLEVQLTMSSGDPGHVAPPLAGAGLSQDLKRYWGPVPQVILHELHTDQDPQLPSVNKSFMIF